jgi:DnaJ-class molecular chaperone
MPDRDYYEILGLSRDASADDIKKAYRKLARQYHPDMNPGDRQAERQFKELQQAYDVLGDPDKRRQYDRFGRQAFQGAGSSPGSWQYTWTSGGPGGTPFDFDLNDILGQFGMGPRGGPRTRGRREAPTGADLTTDVTIPFLVAVQGGTIDVRQLRVRVPPGVESGARVRLKGQGQAAPGGAPGDLYVVVHVESHPYFRREGDHIILDLPLTVTEAALGTSLDVPTIEGNVTLKVHPGTSSGQRLRIRGRGVHKPDGSRGDQLVEVRVTLPKTIDSESRELLRRFGERNPQNPREGLGWPK